MKVLTILGLLSVVACGEDEKFESNDTGLETLEDVEDTDDSSESEDTGNTEETEDTDETDTQEPALILDEGNWSIETPTIVSDTCSLDTYQDVKEFVPPSITIADSTESSFMLDSETECQINDDSFICDPQNFEESVVFGTATMIISNVMSGQIIDSGNIDIEFAVVVEDCEGVGCIGPELVLTWPCPVTLDTSASR
jgi:hypothetical protein